MQQMALAEVGVRVIVASDKNHEESGGATTW